MLIWQPDPKTGEWVGKDIVARHFVVKYVIWGDEDNLWFGYFEQWWREIGKEDDQYVGLSLDEWKIGKLKGVAAMKYRVESFHSHSVRPSMEKLVSAYEADEPAPAD